MPQAQTVAQPPRFPLVVGPENRDADTAKDAKLINAYVEVDQAQQKIFVYKRPGLLQTGTTKTGNGYGVFNWLGDIYSIFGATMYKNGAALVGTLDTTGGMYRFSQCVGATPRMQFGNGVASYNYDSGAGIVQIPAGVDNFPTTCVKGWAYLDGTTYVMDANASIRGCATINDPTDWSDVLNRITAQIEADGGVFLSHQLVYVIALSQWSTEVFYDALNPTGSPLGPVQGAKINYGCANGDSVQEIDGTLFWIATNRSAAAQIIMVDQLKAQIVSTAPVERLLSDADLTAVRSFGLKYAGHRFYGFTLLNDNLTLVYDVKEQRWAQWTDENGNYWPIVSSTYLASTGSVLQHATNGKLYLFNSSYTTDDGAPITVDIYTPNFDGETRRRKHLNILEVVGDRTAGSVLQLRYNDDDYNAAAWSTFREVDLNLAKPILENNGTFIRRAYHLRHKCNTRLRLQAMEMQLDLGTL